VSIDPSHKPIHLTMLSKFHATNSVNDQPALPQSESASLTDEFVHRGNSMVLSIN
jgi:hypothetical protein